jgi:hypothetical protein
MLVEKGAVSITVGGKIGHKTTILVAASQYVDTIKQGMEGISSKILIRIFIVGFKEFLCIKVQSFAFLATSWLYVKG